MRQCGTRSKYVHGCRCELCTTAAREYDRRRFNDPRNPYNLPSLPADDGWMEQGVCRQERAPMEMFFPTRGDSEFFVEAFAMCARCPIREPCLRFGLDHNLDGIWGGTSRRERRRMKKTGRVA